ncbi:MAG: hypothetical protein ABSB19_18585 [Methylomonas sp.]|jgi:hypothetical protein
MLNKIPNLNYPKIKLLILSLLSIDIFIYALADSLLSALDALAWVGLLILYDLEAEAIPVTITKTTLHGCRIALIALVVAVFFSYWYSKAWLDVGNALLWFALIAMLEFEMRFPGKVAEFKKHLRFSMLVVFAGLIVMALVLLLKSYWLDAYDAILWILAFALLEVDIIKFLQIRQG